MTIWSMGLSRSVSKQATKTVSSGRFNGVFDDSIRWIWGWFSDKPGVFVGVSPTYNWAKKSHWAKKRVNHQVQKRDRRKNTGPKVGRKSGNSFIFLCLILRKFVSYKLYITVCFDPHFGGMAIIYQLNAMMVYNSGIYQLNAMMLEPSNCARYEQLAEYQALVSRAPAQMEMLASLGELW